jgi:hypothetical protein
MAAPTLSREREREGRLLCSRIEQGGVPLEAAFWAYHSLLGRWRLFLITPAVDTEGPRWVRRRVRELLGAADGGAAISLDTDDIDVDTPLHPDILAMIGDLSVGRDAALRDHTSSHPVFGRVRPYFVDLRSVPREPALTPA